jgi:hypothetical protein
MPLMTVSTTVITVLHYAEDVHVPMSHDYPWIPEYLFYR